MLSRLAQRRPAVPERISSPRPPLVHERIILRHRTDDAEAFALLFPLQSYGPWINFNLPLLTSRARGWPTFAVLAKVGIHAAWVEVFIFASPH